MSAPASSQRGLTIIKATAKGPQLMPEPAWSPMARSPTSGSQSSQFDIELDEESGATSQRPAPSPPRLRGVSPAQQSPLRAARHASADPEEVVTAFRAPPGAVLPAPAAQSVDTAKSVPAAAESQSAGTLAAKEAQLQHKTMRGTHGHAAEAQRKWRSFDVGSNVGAAPDASSQDGTACGPHNYADLHRHSVANFQLGSSWHEAGYRTLAPHGNTRAQVRSYAATIKFKCRALFVVALALECCVRCLFQACWRCLLFCLALNCHLPLSPSQRTRSVCMT